MQRAFFKYKIPSTLIGVMSSSPFGNRVGFVGTGVGTVLGRSLSTSDFKLSAFNCFHVAWLG